MSSQPAILTNRPLSHFRRSLEDQIAIVMEKCINCPKCQAECAFLKQNGTPGAIAANCNTNAISQLTLAFDCSLCGLCTAVCPVDLSPVDLFLEMRREAVDRGAAPLPAHRGIMAYEARGVSKKYSWYSLPDGCDTVLFPGCTFAGTRMDTTIALYERLKQTIPSLGIVLDCCCKLSHDLGRDACFKDMFEEMRAWLSDHGVRTVIVICPNCFRVFKDYGSSLSVTTAYAILAKAELLTSAKDPEQISLSTVAVHDPCVVRNEPEIQAFVRELAVGAGFDIEEMPHSGKKALCCGEGGSVGCVTPGFARTWGDLRKKEAGDRRLLTYCAGCANFLNKNIPTDHVLDAIFHPEAVAAGTRKAAKAPFTYLNRLRLKRYLQKKHPAPVSRERDFTSPSAQGAAANSGAIRKMFILAVIAAAIAGIRFSV